MACSRTNRVPLWRSMFRIFMAIVLTALSPLFAVFTFVAPSVFLVYGEARHIHLFFPPWWPKWLPPAFLVNFYRTGGGRAGRWGVTFGLRWPRSQISKQPKIPAKAVRVLRHIARRCKALALAGQLPTFVELGECEISGERRLLPPCVGGDLGTLFAMRAAARAGADYLQRPISDLVIAIPGGAGRIGLRLVALLGQEFSHVIAIDNKYKETNVEGNITRTSDPQLVSAADLILALTPRGEDLEPLLSYVRAEQLFLDDTHPDVPRHLRDRLKNLGVVLRKPAVSREGFRWLIRELPGYRPTAIPGCLVEAFVVSAFGRTATQDFETFSGYAEQLGFYPQLFEHPDYI